METAYKNTKTQRRGEPSEPFLQLQYDRTPASGSVSRKLLPPLRYSSAAVMVDNEKFSQSGYKLPGRGMLEAADASSKEDIEANIRKLLQGAAR
jgi:hypothetical protein